MLATVRNACNLLQRGPGKNLQRTMSASRLWVGDAGASPSEVPPAGWPFPVPPGFIFCPTRRILQLERWWRDYPPPWAPYATSTDRGGQMFIVNIIGLAVSLASVALRIHSALYASLARHDNSLLCLL